jgi:outer membrane autotransporter protein
VLTVAPKVGFGYGEILQAKHDLYEASLDSKNAFEGTLGLDVSTKIQGFELFSSLEYAAQLGSTMVTIEDERHHVSYSKTSLTFGIKGDVDQNSKMYGSFNFAPETASASFAVGMNIKF